MRSVPSSAKEPTVNAGSPPENTAYAPGDSGTVPIARAVIRRSGCETLVTVTVKVVTTGATMSSSSSHAAVASTESKPIIYIRFILPPLFDVRWWRIRCATN